MFCSNFTAANKTATLKSDLKKKKDFVYDYERQ